MFASRADALACLATFGVGVALKKGLDSGFDYVVYPAALLVLGYGWGGLVMTLLSVAVNVVFIRAYDWARCDFLLIERLKRMQVVGTGAGSPVVRALRVRKTLAFFVLSWVEDPAVVTLYLRTGSHRFDGLSRADWMIFLASTVVSNLMWMAGIGAVAETLRWLFTAIAP